MSLGTSSLTSFIALLFLIFKRPKIGSYYNPIFFYWVSFFIFPTLLNSVINPNILNPWISISTNSIFIIALYFPPNIIVKARIRLIKITKINLILYFILFLLPNIINFYNTDISIISDFSERNSSILSMPLAVLSRALSSLQLAFIAISSGLLWKISLITLVISNLWSILNYSYLNSKAGLVPLLFQFIGYFYLRKVVLRSNDIAVSSSKFVINSKVISPFELVLRNLKSTKINVKFVIYLLSFAILSSISVFLLQRLGFNISRLIDRIVMNFDTLIYLSDVIENDSLSVSESGFITILSVWFKPIVGILNLPIEYPYRSVVQYIYSKWSGYYWYSSSLGNSNLVAESIVSSGLYLGVLTSPILMWLLLKFLQRSIARFSITSLLVSFPLTLYINSYTFFASAQEYLMTIYAYVPLFFSLYVIRWLTGKMKPRSANTTTLTPAVNHWTP